MSGAGTGMCTFTATCAGHTYQAQCNAANSSCRCVIDSGLNSPIVNATCTQSAQTIWMACNFP
jgi:hypothetical protein